MNATYYIFKILQVWSWFICATLIFSFLVMFCGFNMFKKTTTKETNAFIPMYNLLILLDIVKMPRIYFVLLLLPVINLITILVILYRISIVFGTSKKFSIGLILLPVIFMPILNYFKLMIVEDSVEEKKDDVTPEMVSMLTPEEIEILNTDPVEEEKVDNVFKAPTVNAAEVPTFKATNRVKYEEIVGEQPIEPKIERVTPVEVQEIKTTKFINDINDEDDQIEIVEL